jgi:hypothetical protein
MKRTVIGFALIAILSVSVVPYVSPPVFGQTASAQAPHIGEGGLPQFEKDPAWPKSRQSGRWDSGPLSQSTSRTACGSSVGRAHW